jgi:hypothetical protein
MCRRSVDQVQCAGGHCTDRGPTVNTRCSVKYQCVLFRERLGFPAAGVCIELHVFGIRLARGRSRLLQHEGCPGRGQQPEKQRSAGLLSVSLNCC